MKNENILSFFILGLAGREIKLEKYFLGLGFGIWREIQKYQKFLKYVAKHVLFLAFLFCSLDFKGHERVERGFEREHVDHGKAGGPANSGDAGSQTGPKGQMGTQAV